MRHLHRWLSISCCAALLDAAIALTALAQSPDDGRGEGGEDHWLLEAAALVIAEPDDDPSDAAPAVDRDPRLWVDAVLLGVGTAAYGLAKPDTRGRILERGSIGHVLENFRDPIGRAIESNDRDSFITNYVAHPVSWASVSYYLKERGYSDLEALAFSQAHSVYWEYVIEGSYALPSGRDVVTNFVSSVVTIFGIHKLVGVAIRSGDPRVADDGPGGDDGPVSLGFGTTSASRSGPRVSMAPPVAYGPGGPMVQFAFRVR